MIDKCARNDHHGADAALLRADSIGQVGEIDFATLKLVFHLNNLLIVM